MNFNSSLNSIANSQEQIELNFHPSEDFFLSFENNLFETNSDINTSINCIQEKHTRALFNSTPNTQCKAKLNRRDYYLKHIKVLAFSKWLIAKLNLHLREVYHLRLKLQKPSQTFITETNILKNKLWMSLPIEDLLTKNFNEYYPNCQMKNTHWEKKRLKNIKIFSLLHRKYSELYEADPEFNKTMMNVLEEYIVSEQLIIDKKNKGTQEEQALFELYAKGDVNTPSIVEYYLMTPGNKMKKDI